MGDDIQDGGDPAEAFDRLRAVIEGQDRELALLRRAVEGLAAERAAIDVPDYTETLGVLQQGVNTATGRINAIGQILAKAPALTMTPEDMAQRIAAAGSTARREDQAALARAGEDKARVMADLRAIAGSAWTRADQRNRQLWFGLGGVAIGALLWAIMPGLVAREIAPASWQWPERMAARTLDMSMWDAGQRMMDIANHGSWRGIISATDLVRDNQTAIETCFYTAGRIRKAVRCTIEVKPVPTLSSR